MHMQRKPFPLVFDFADFVAAGTVRNPFGAIAQLVERFHGMEEVRGSIPLSSTPKRQMPVTRCHGHLRFTPQMGGV